MKLLNLILAGLLSFSVCANDVDAGDVVDEVCVPTEEMECPEEDEAEAEK